MTDNYYKQSGREVFQLTSAGQLYSVTNNAWYGTQTGITTGKLFWDTRSQFANTTFTGTAVTDGTGRLQLGLRQSTTSSALDVFCVSSTITTDSNSATGFHVYFYPPGTTQSQTGSCTITQLYLSPITNGRIAQRDLNVVTGMAEGTELEETAMGFESDNAEEPLIPSFTGRARRRVHFY